MRLSADDIRCINDRKLFDTLSVDPDVKRAKEAIEKAEEKGPTGVRRRLLSSSVRLSPGMAPSVHHVKDECADRLGIETAMELYVYNSPQFNAAAVKPEADRLFIMFSSSLLEAFSEKEMQFVMGHELGHHLYHHHDMPIGYVLQGPVRPNPRLALQLFAWSRYAEISADRAGAHCTGSFDSVGSALFRLASGLGENVVQFKLDEFLDQLDDIQVEMTQPGGGGPREDWFSTHPFSPLRVKALEYYFESEFVRKGGAPSEELEAAVQGIMSMMEPSYVDGRTRTTEAMRRLLFAGAVLLANASDGIDESEIEQFEKFFGIGSLSTDLNLDRLRSEMPGRIQQVRELASEAQCMQVIRDLCLIAKANDFVAPTEYEVLASIATGLNVSPAFVDSVLYSNPELD